VRVCVKLGSNAVLRCEAIQVRHRRIANDLRIAVIFFHDQYHVAESRLARWNWRLYRRRAFAAIAAAASDLQRGDE